MPVKLVVVSYSKMKNEMEEVWNKFKSKIDIQVIEGVFGEALRYAKELENKGNVEVYISAGANAAILRQNVTTPVVAIKVTGFDLFRSIQYAQKYNGKIAVVNFETRIPELQEIQELLRVSIIQEVYKDEIDLGRKIKNLKKAGIKTIVGHSLACDFAEKYGLQSVLVYTREAVRQAIENAYELALSRRREMEKAERLQAILDYTYSGVIATDNRGIITVFNKVAEEIMGIPAQKAINHYVDKVVPNTRINYVIETGKAELNQLQKIGSSYIFTNRIPICTHNELVGVVATFQDVTTIQKAESHIRKNLHAKGLVAKFNFDDILGKSPALLETLKLAQKFARTESTIMITGETGTGKELLAQSIHNYSIRRNKPFVAINCSALPENLLESELFGYEEGAFTGAKRGGKIGLFELAHTGTIFLDEISEIPLILQSRLLRVLQEREIMKVGSDRIIPVDVRVITATNKNLWKAVKEGKIRDDLFYRLNVLHIKLPPLRQRTGDIALLAQYYMEKFDAGLFDACNKYFSGIVSFLENYNWPGNIRELRNVIERLAVLMKGSDISSDKLNSYICDALNYYDSSSEISEDTNSHSKTKFPQNKIEISPEVIARVLAETKGNKAEAARRLGFSRMTLWRKIKNR